jgi:hypothetical protein
MPLHTALNEAQIYRRESDIERSIIIQEWNNHNKELEF